MMEEEYSSTGENKSSDVKDIVTNLVSDIYIDNIRIYVHNVRDEASESMSESVGESMSEWVIYLYFWMYRGLVSLIHLCQVQFSCSLMQSFNVAIIDMYFV